MSCDKKRKREPAAEGSKEDTVLLDEVDQEIEFENGLVDSGITGRDKAVQRVGDDYDEIDEMQLGGSGTDDGSIQTTTPLAGDSNGVDLMQQCSPLQDEDVMHDSNQKNGEGDDMNKGIAERDARSSRHFNEEGRGIMMREREIDHAENRYERNNESSSRHPARTRCRSQKQSQHVQEEQLDDEFCLWYRDFLINCKPVLSKDYEVEGMQYEVVTAGVVVPQLASK